MHVTTAQSLLVARRVTLVVAFGFLWDLRMLFGHSITAGGGDAKTPPCARDTVFRPYYFDCNIPLHWRSGKSRLIDRIRLFPSNFQVF